MVLGMQKCIKPANFQVFLNTEDKFLPILFNNYLQSPDKSILSLLKEYPTSPLYAENLSKKLMQKILEAKQQNKNKEAHLLMDILIKICAKLTSLDTKEKDLMIEFVKNYIESSDGALQKKAYRMLRSLCTVDTKLVENLLVNGEIKTCNEVARKERLKVYHFLMKNYPIEKTLVMLNKFLLEIIHCIKSSSRKTRDLCKTFVLNIGSKLHSFGLFMNMWNSLLAGLASNIDSTKSTTVDILRLLLKNYSFSKPQSMFATDLDQDNCLYSISNIVILLLKDSSKEVVRSSLKFLKTVIPYMSETTANSISSGVIQNIFAKEDLNSSNKNNIKFVIEKLIKKVGFENLEKIFPLEHKKLLQHVLKESKKKSKKKTDKKVEKNDNDFDMDLEGKEKEIVNEKNEMPREYHFLNPLDLPATKKSKKVVKPKSDFDVQDEKLIINEDDSSDSDGKTKKKRKLSENSSKIEKPNKKTKAVAFVQISSDMISRKKPSTSSLNKVVSKAKQGVLKGLKARKKKFNY